MEWLGTDPGKTMEPAAVASTQVCPPQLWNPRELYDTWCLMHMGGGGGAQNPESLSDIHGLEES